MSFESIVVYCSHLTKHFGEIKAITNLSFAIREKTIFGLMGPNGAGKTTTLRILAGILLPTAGECTIYGNDIYKNRNAIKKMTGIVPESSGIYQNLTATEFLLFIAALYDIDIDVAMKKIDYYYSLLEFEDQKYSLSELSRGQRQKIMFISSVINDPKVLLLDEPIASLDPFIAHRLKKHIKGLATNRVIIVSSHNANLIEELCDEVLFLSNGKALIENTPTELKEIYNSSTLEESYLKAVRNY